MDLEQHDELLSAYLDRELSPDERAGVERLLENSSEARRRLRELEATSHFFAQLPQEQLEADFADGIIDELGRRALLRPEPAASPRRGRRWARWAAPLAAAAAVVLLVWSHRPPLPQNAAPSLPQPDRSASLVRSAPEPAPDAFGAIVAPGDMLPGSLPGWIVVDVVDRSRGMKAVEYLLAENNILVTPAEAETRAPNAPAADSVAGFSVEADVKELASLLTQLRAQEGTDSPILQVAVDKSETAVLGRFEQSVAPQRELEDKSVALFESLKRLQSDEVGAATSAPPARAAGRAVEPAALADDKAGAPPSDVARTRRFTQGPASKQLGVRRAESEPDAPRANAPGSVPYAADTKDRAQRDPAADPVEMAIRQPKLAARSTQTNQRGVAQVFEVPGTLDSVRSLIRLETVAAGKPRGAVAAPAPAESTGRQQMLLFIIENADPNRQQKRN